MAGALTADAEQRLLYWMLVDAETAVPFEGPIMMRLMGVNGSATVAGTEIVGDSYEEVEVAFSLSTATPGITYTNTFEVEFPSLDEDAVVTVAGVELWDSSETSPARIAYATFSPSYSVAAGEPLTIAPGQVTVKLQ